jgi:hypothetical protein
MRSPAPAFESNERVILGDAAARGGETRRESYMQSLDRCWMHLLSMCAISHGEPSDSCRDPHPFPPPLRRDLKPEDFIREGSLEMVQNSLNSKISRAEDAANVAFCTRRRLSPLTCIPARHMFVRSCCWWCRAHGGILSSVTHLTQILVPAA